MKKYIVILFIFSSLVLKAQSEVNYQGVIEQFQKLYNAQNAEAIYDLFDTSMQQALTLEQTKGFVNQFYAQLGAIQSFEFLREEERRVYLVDFEKGEQDMFVALNSENLITGLLFKPHKPDNLPVIERNTTKMILPFHGAWNVFWGGTEVSKNYHVAYENQQYAYDILIIKDDKSYDGDPQKNESYYAFGKDIIAPCDAKVVKVITGVHDNVPGELNPQQLTGNTVILETANKEYILFAHLKKGTVAVKEVQQVKQGDLLGQCGNSGNTTEAHLHLSLQNVIDMSIATGGKLYFDKILVNGEVKEDYLPERNDKIQNIKL